MSVEGEATSEPLGEAGKRYYVVSSYGERGPYTLEQLRASVAETALSAATLVRADGESRVGALGKLLARRAKPALAPEVPAAETERAPRRPRAKRTGARSPIDLSNEYAPPGEDDVEEAGGERREDPGEGSFGLGFALGFFGGCIALILSRNAKPQTRQGVAMGFGVATVLGIVIRFASPGR